MIVLVWLMSSVSLVSGLAAGLAGAFVFHPLDLIKTRNQANESNHRVGLLQHAKDIYHESGIRGFYRGVVASCLGAGVSWGLYFGMYEASKSYLYQRAEHMPFFQHEDTGLDYSSSPMLNYIAGTFAGCFTVVVTNPIWVIKTRLELQRAGQEHYRGLIQTTKRIVAEEGTAGLYKGLVPALILTSNGAIQLMIYEDLKLRLHETFFNGPISFAFLGAVSKGIASTITYPYQVVKTRMQQRQLGNRVQYVGTVQTFRLVVRNEGVGALYKGLWANVLRVMPSSALTFCVYEVCKAILT